MELDSTDQWEHLESVQKTKNLILDSDPAATDLSEDFFNRLHDKVMNEIQNREPLPKTWPKSWRWASKRKWWWRSFTFSVLFLFLGYSNAYVSYLTQSHKGQFDQLK